ncbi:MAG: hypothetical protein KF754_16100 [Planctomycetes bacterium]|nr:hypothetical protein [Planctomycetota bacterium]
MWPLRRTSRREYVRIGRISVERWAEEGAGLSLIGQQPVPTDVIDAPEGLAQAVAALYADKPRCKVTLLLESAWSPLLLADTGGVVWGDGPVSALVRHRLGLLYGSLDEDVAAWDIRVDHRAGDRYALGFGLSPRIKQGLLGAAQNAGLTLEAMVPAFLWGCQRLRPARRWTRQTGWWIWAEQDRMLVARIEAGRVVVLNPASPVHDTTASVEQQVRIEGARWGGDASREPVSVAAWSRLVELPPSTERLSWCSAIGEVSVEASSIGKPQVAKVSA